MLISSDVNLHPALVQMRVTLFFDAAIAMLRDDTDDSQWFVYPPENIWFICDDDDINYARENIKDSVQAAWFHCSHKATVKELIEHFKSV